MNTSNPPLAANTAPSEPALVEIERHGRSATVRMNRPKARNALGPALILALKQAFLELAADAEVRAIVLAGHGPAFCAGADLNAMRAAADYTPEQNVADALRLSRLLNVIDTCPKPVIARVHGPAFAGGMGLVAACDIAIASDLASFRLSEVRLGLIPAMISPYVTRALGARATQRYALSAEIFDARRAAALGFVHEVVAEDQLDATIQAILSELEANSPQAMSACKQLLADVYRAGRDADAEEPALANQLAQRIAQQRASDDGREGLNSFLEKRAPRWQL